MSKYRICSIDIDVNVAYLKYLVYDFVARGKIVLCYSFTVLVVLLWVAIPTFSPVGNFCVSF